MNKLLIANRGEIAVRIVRTCRDMGLGTVAVYSACDRRALHVRLADEAYGIGADPAADSYLRGDRIIDAARRSGADAVHPGYGFLSENAGFAEACQRAGLTFIGPPAAAMRAMGSKTAARRVAESVGVPVIPGALVPAAESAGESDLRAIADAVGWPLLVKAVDGGGGKGMRVVSAPDDLTDAVQRARSEARSAFGSDAVYLERRLDRPRHIEVQLLGDRDGQIVPFVERECSIQRRHQKLVEESPSPAVTPELRSRLQEAAVAVARAAGYTSAGTAEFLVDRAGAFYFLEMNARLQVEHPVTEAITGLDLVRAQIEIAAGLPLDEVLARGRSGPFGHAIEARIYAEDPDEGFLPSPGRITYLRPPSGPGIRDDSGVYEGWVVPTAYDPLLSKTIAWGPDRQAAMARLVRALGEYDLRGIRTTIGFCRRLVASEDFAAARFDTTYVDRLLASSAPDTPSADDVRLLAAASAIRALRRTAVPASAADAGSAASRWTSQARAESLR